VELDPEIPRFVPWLAAFSVALAVVAVFRVLQRDVFGLFLDLLRPPRTHKDDVLGTMEGMQDIWMAPNVRWAGGTVTVLVDDERRKPKPEQVAIAKALLPQLRSLDKSARAHLAPHVGGEGARMELANLSMGKDRGAFSLDYSFEDSDELFIVSFVGDTPTAWRRE